MDSYLQATVTVLSLINPVVCGAMFSTLESGRPAGARVADATRVALSVLAVLLGAALVGGWVLHLFGVSMEALRIAGGGVVAWLGWGMLAGRKTVQPPASDDSGGSTILPLVLFAAGPGTITGVMTVSAHHSQLGLPLTGLVAVVLSVLVTWCTLLVSAHLKTRQGLVHDLTTRLMGLLVLAMGVQIALGGIKDFLAT